MKRKTITDIALGLKEYYSSSDIYVLLDALGITIITKASIDGKKAKCTRNILGDEYIYISPEVDENEKEFILTHELGHLILHKNIASHYYEYSLLNKDKIEFEANYFAMELLLPKNLDNIELEGFTAEQLSVMYKIPVDLIMIKCEEINSQSEGRCFLCQDI